MTIYRVVVHHMWYTFMWISDDKDDADYNNDDRVGCRNYFDMTFIHLNIV